MKKLLIFILCLSLLCLGGCGTPAMGTLSSVLYVPAASMVGSSDFKIPVIPEPPVPETESVTVLADRTNVILETVNRGDIVDIVTDFDDDYYIVKTEQGYGLIEKRLVRIEGEDSYEAWDAYATSGALFYENYHMSPAGAEELSRNTELLIIDSFDGIYIVQIEDSIGYMYDWDVSSTYIKSTPSYSGGGGGGGNSGGGDSSGADGGDISLGIIIGNPSVLSFMAPQEGEGASGATVIVNDAEIILGWFDRNETADVIIEDGFAEEKDGFVAIFKDGLIGYIQQNFILSSEESPYESWVGYARSDAEFYDNYYLAGESVDTLSTNTEITVLCDFGDCVLVIADGFSGYMSVDDISESLITYSYSGGSGGGGNSGNSGNSGGEWTEPVL